MRHMRHPLNCRFTGNPAVRGRFPWGLLPTHPWNLAALATCSALPGQNANCQISSGRKCADRAHAVRWANSLDARGFSAPPGGGADDTAAHRRFSPAQARSAHRTLPVAPRRGRRGNRARGLRRNLREASRAPGRPPPASIPRFAHAGRVCLMPFHIGESRRK